MARGCTGAPADLVQIVTGYGEAGNALVTGGVDKLIFVGSTKVGVAPTIDRPITALFQHLVCNAYEVL